MTAEGLYKRAVSLDDSNPEAKEALHNINDTIQVSGPEHLHHNFGWPPGTPWFYVGLNYSSNNNGLKKISQVYCGRMVLSNHASFKSLEGSHDK